MKFCPKCDYKNMTFRSNGEKELGEEIMSFYDGEMKFNKYVGGYECDIVLPEKKIAIDYNGLYWHSELYRPKSYHISKKRKVEEYGYSLIYIWEDDWRDSVKHDIILSRIKSRLGLNDKVYARQCEVKKLTTQAEISECVEFLDTNHLQGHARAKHYYGLFYEGELVELVSIGKSRKLISGSRDEYELIRMCSKNGVTVVGGFTRLMKYAMSDLKLDKLISYIDLDWSGLMNNSYTKTGFSEVSVTAPNYWWVKDSGRENRMKYTKASLVKRGEDPSKTESEIMRDKGYYKVFGTGNMKVELNVQAMLDSK